MTKREGQSDRTSGSSAESTISVSRCYRLPAVRKRFFLSFLAVLCTAMSSLSHAAVKVFPVPGELRADHFRVTVNGRKADVVHAASGYYILSFDLRGSAKIAITAPTADYWKRGVEVQPWRQNVRPEVHGRTITFTLRAPAKLSIARPGDHFADAEMLFLFANAPETYIPNPVASGVRYYRAGVYHENIDAHSGDLIYLAPGAVIFGGLNLWQVHDVRVLGRGTFVYDGPQDPTTDQGWMHKRNWHCIVMDNAQNIEIDGITCIVRSRTWQIQMKDSRHIGFNNIKVIGGNPNDANQDGMDWLGGGDTSVRDSFFRASDDVFAMQGNWDGYSQEAMLTPGHDVSNITIEDTVVSTSISNIVRMGWPRKIFNSSNFLMRNVDVLHMGYGSCGIPFALLGVWADQGARGEHANYRFEDIRLEHWYSLLQLDKPLPGLHDVYLDRVSALDGPSMVPSVIQGAITGTVLNGVSVSGRVASSDRDIPLQVLGGAAPMRYESSALQPAIRYTAGALAPRQAITFTAATRPDAGGGAHYEWLFGDGATAIGPAARHAFPDAAGTLEDGSGRFRVLLKTTDAAGTSTWSARSVVVGRSPLPAIEVSAPLRHGLRIETKRGSSTDPASLELDGSHLRDALATAPVGTTVSFGGYLDVPSDGGYTVWLLSSGHSTLAIDGLALASSPKPRALVCGTPGYATQAALGSAVLRKGLHRIELTAERAPGDGTLALKWEGPGMLLSDVPDTALKHTSAFGEQ